MSIHFTSMTVGQLADRAKQMAAESADLAKLSAMMSHYEKRYGCTLFLNTAEPGTEYVGTPAPVKVQLPAELVAEAEAGPEVIKQLPPEEPAPDRGLTVSKLPVRADPHVDTPAEAPPAPEPIKESRPPADMLARKPAPAPEPVKKPEPAPTPAGNVQKVHSAPAAVPQRADRPWGALSLPARRIVQHLEKLPRTFTPAEDLTIVEMLVHGNKVEQVAALVEMPTDAVLTRWKSFLCSDVLGPNGKPSIDGQQQQLAALRYRKDNPNE